MALIGKIRSKTAMLLGFIGIAMLIFLVQEAISSNSMMGGSSKNLGKINGKKVDANQFFNEETVYEDRIKTLNPNLEMNEKNRFLIRQEIWDNFAFDDIFGKTIKQLGLSVTPDELAEAFKGNEISPLVMNVIGQSFVDPRTGTFDKAKMQYALNNMDKVDPRLKEMVLKLEPLVEQDRVRAKYTSLVQKSAYFPTFLAKELLESQKSATADILSIPYTAISDPSIKVSDKEIEAYIQNHALKYKRDANIVLDIVTFDIVPNEADTRDIVNQLIEIKNELKTTDDDSLFIARSSVQGGAIHYLTPQEIAQSGSPKADSINSAPVGSFIGPYKNGDAMLLTYIVDRKMIPDSVRASRLVLAYQSNDDITNKSELADKIIQEVQSGTSTFAQEVMKYSSDTASKQNGGDMGAFPRGALDPSLEQKLFYEMPVGKVEKIETQDGIILIQKTGQIGSQIGTRAVDFSNDLVASDATVKEIYNKANQFWQSSRTPQDFDKNSKSQKVQNNVTVYAKGFEVNNLDGTRPIIQWAFKDGKPDQVNFFDLPNLYAIVKINAKNDAGVASVEEVKDEVTEILTNKKKAAFIEKKLTDAKTANLDAIAQKVNGNVVTNVITQYNSIYIDRIGVEPKVVGTIFGTKTNAQSAAIEGNNGVYVVKTLTIQPLNNPLDDKTIEAFKKQISSQTASQLNFNTIFESVLRNTKVEDKRYLMF